MSSSSSFYGYWKRGSLAFCQQGTQPVNIIYPSRIRNGAPTPDLADGHDSSPMLNPQILNELLASVSSQIQNFIAPIVFDYIFTVEIINRNR